MKKINEDMKMSRNPAKELEYLARACQESAEDIRSIRSGAPVNYNLDFALLCPVVFPQPGRGSKDFFAPPIAAVRRVLSNARAGAFQIVMSGYTMMEFFDQLAHMERHLGMARPDLYASVDERKLREQLMTSQALRRQLLQYTEGGIGKLVREPVTHMIELLRSGAIRGIGDVIDTTRVRREVDSGQFRKFFDAQRKERLPIDRGRREVDDSEFHYKIDAANNCLTLAVAKADDGAAYFVTSTPMNIRQCTTRDSSYARMDRTPLFVMNALELAAKGVVRDDVKYLERMARRSLEYAGEIGAGRSLDSAAVDTQLEVTRHFWDISQMLGRTDAVEPEQIERSVEEITAALHDPDGMLDRMESAVAELKAGARRLEAEAASLDLGYVGDFDFSNDPVLERVRRQLDLDS